MLYAGVTSGTVLAVPPVLRSLAVKSKPMYHRDHPGVLQPLLLDIANKGAFDMHVVDRQSWHFVLHVTVFRWML